MDGPSGIGSTSAPGTRSLRQSAGLTGPGTDQVGLDRAGLDGTGLDGTGLDGTGLDGTGLDGTGLDVTGIVVTGDDGPGPVQTVPGQVIDRGAAAGERRPVAAGRRSRLKLTGRGAVLAMVAVFFLGSLIGVAAQVSWVAGLSYVAGCLLAATYARRESLLMVVTAPPLIFLVMLVLAELITASRSAALATAEGTLLTLAAVAPWLLAGTAAYLVVAMMRGLPRCIRDLRIGLSGRTDLENSPPRFGPTQL